MIAAKVQLVILIACKIQAVFGKDLPSENRKRQDTLPSSQYLKINLQWQMHPDFQEWHILLTEHADD